MYLAPALRYRICPRLPYELWIKIMEYALYHPRFLHLNLNYKTLWDHIFRMRVTDDEKHITLYFDDLKLEQYYVLLFN
jgi:hypothetical protein